MTLEKVIRYEITKVCIKLKLKHIEIKFNTDDRICFSRRINPYSDIDYIFIQIDIVRLMALVKIKTEEDLFKIIKLNSISKRLKFVLYHEVGHYLQYYRHRKWFLYQRKNKYRKGWNSEIEYRNQPLENKADRISLYLLKEDGIKQ